MRTLDKSPVFLFDRKKQSAPDMLLQYSLHAPRRGRADVKAFMAGFRAAFPDLSFSGAADLIETKLFTNLVQAYLADDEYANLQRAIAEDPNAGDVIKGSGGVRTLR